MLKARQYARELQCDPWEFAVEIDRLRDHGLTTSDLRWLVKQGYIEHGCEITQPQDGSRRFQPSQNLAFSATSCFALTGAGLLSLEGDPSITVISHVGASGTPPSAFRLPPSGGASGTHPTPLPHWDHNERALYVGEQLVKGYRVPSPNQEAVLSAFEEEGWPRLVDDPLPPIGDQNPKQRLRDTIRCLNGSQVNHLIRFRGDGTGERVRWELVGA